MSKPVSNADGKNISSRFLSGINLNSLSVDQLPDPPSPKSQYVRRSTRIQKSKHQSNETKLVNDSITGTPSTISRQRDWKDTRELSCIFRDGKRSKSHISRRRSSPNLTPPSFSYIDEEKPSSSPLQDMTNKNKELRSLKSLKNKLNSCSQRRSSISSKHSKIRRNSLSFIPSQPSDVITKTLMNDLPASDDQSHDNRITTKYAHENNKKKRRQSILLPSDIDNDGGLINDDGDTIELAKYMQFGSRNSALSKVGEKYKKSDDQPKKKRNLLPPTYNNLKSSRTNNDYVTNLDNRNENKTKYIKQLITKESNHPKYFASNINTVEKINHSVNIVEKTSKNDLSKDKRESCTSQTTTPTDKTYNTVQLKDDSIKKRNHDQSLLQNIRKYCSLPVSQREVHPCYPANLIEQVTKYKLPPRIGSEGQTNNQLTPNDKQKENKNPIGKNEHSFLSNLDKKRELLLKLGPIVDQLEEQRKQQSIDLENITQCKVLSKRGRYEYIHKQTGKKVPPDVYKKLYLSHIEKTRLKLKSKEKTEHQQNKIPKNIPVKTTINNENPIVFNANESNEIAETIQSIFDDSPSSPWNSEEKSSMSLKRTIKSRRSLAPILGPINKKKVYETETNNDMSISMDIDSDEESHDNNNMKIIDKSNLLHLKQIDVYASRQSMDSKFNSKSYTKDKNMENDKEWVYKCYVHTSNVISKYLPREETTANNPSMLKAKEKLLSNIRDALVSYSTEVMEINRKSTR